MTNKMEAAANDFANARDTDVLVYNGPISAPMARGFETLVVGRRRRKNCALFLCTGGGDADAAYRIARCLQRSYGHVTVHVCGWCKSAGTLIAIGAHTVAMTDGGELGPLDVQVGKKDELFETDSGLTVLAAITALENKAFDLFENAFLSLKGRSNGRITLKTATELATKLSIGIITPIMEQIDPMHVGSVTRAMEIGVEYGTRLAGLSGNLKDGAIDKLANAYPAHSFVIDRVEAETLFNEVRLLDEDELALISVFGDAVSVPSNKPIIGYISNPPDLKPSTVEGAANEAHNGQDAGAGRTADDQAAEGIGGSVESAEPTEGHPAQPLRLSKKAAAKGVAANGG